MKRAGCWMIGYGIESINQQILNNVNKNTSLSQIEEAISLSKTADLEVTAHIIFGLPGETMQTGLNTINWLINTNNIDFAQIYCAVPWPSTALYKLAKEKGWLTTQNWKLYEQNNYIMDIGSIAPKQVEYLRSRAIIRFYLSPRRIVRILKKINSLKKIRMFTKTFFEFLGWI